MKTRISKCFWVFLAALVITAFSPAGARAEKVDLGDGVAAEILGRADKTGDNLWVLALGTRVGISGIPGIASQTLTAHADGVQIELRPKGVEFASGLFSLRTESSQGDIIHVPGSLTYLAMKRDPKPEEDALVYAGYDADLSGSLRGVMWNGSLFRVKGKTSVEMLHAAKGDLPERFVSLSGEADGVFISSNLYDRANLEASRDNLWQMANQELVDQRKMLREIRIDQNRPGAAAYRATIIEALEGLTKLKKGYDLLQSRQYTEEVLKRMLQAGRGIPRLDLASIRVVEGETAVSIEPFQNWQGQGRVLCNLAYFTNRQAPAPAGSSWGFVLDDSWGRIGEQTRVRVADGDALVETRRNEESEWTLRPEHQFDLLAEAGFLADDSQAGVSLDVDVTGFLLRKAFNVVGQISLGTVELTPDRMTVHYKPESPGQTVASRFSSFIPLKTLLCFPRRDDFIDRFRPEFLDEKAWNAIQDALDRMAQAVYDARIDQIDDFTLTLARGEGKTWLLQGAATAPNGRTAAAEYQVEFNTDPLAEVWDQVGKNRKAATWLDLDFDLGSFGM